MSTPQLYKATGIILKRTSVGEGDKIIWVLCEHLGKKRFIGKGIRKITSRRAGHLELFSKTEFLIHHGKSLDFISGATVKRVYGLRYHHLSQIAAAYIVCEIADRLIMEGQEHDESYYLLDSILSDLETIDVHDINTRLRTYIDDILITLGFKRKETKSTTLEQSIAAVEHIIERKIRSVKLLSRAGMTG